MLLGATHLIERTEDPDEALRIALATGRPVFGGVLATDAEAECIRQMMDDAAAEAVGTTYRERG